MKTGIIDDRSKIISRLFALAWLKAQQSQSAAQLTPDILEAITRLDLGDRAFRQALMIPNEIRRVDALISICYGAYATQQMKVFQEAVQMAEDILDHAAEDPFDSGIEAKGAMVCMWASTGQIDLARKKVSELGTEAQNTKEEFGITSTAEMSLARAWVSVGEIE